MIMGCSWCGKNQNDNGEWEHDGKRAETHGICPICKAQYTDEAGNLIEPKREVRMTKKEFLKKAGWKPHGGRPKSNLPPAKVRSIRVTDILWNKIPDPKNKYIIKAVVKAMAQDAVKKIPSLPVKKL